MTNVIEFKRPAKPPEDPLLYTVELREKSSHFYGEMEGEIDRVHAADTLFDAAFHVLSDTDNCHALIMLGDDRTCTFRGHDSFETEAQRAWLARRLDTVYENLTGRRRPGILQRLETFIRNLFNRSRP